MILVISCNGNESDDKLFPFEEISYGHGEVEIGTT